MRLEKWTDAIAAKLDLPAGKGEDFVKDPGLSGHGVRLRRLKSGEVSRKWGTPPKRLPNGAQRRGDFGEVGTVPLADARKAAQQFYGKIARGEDPAAERKQAQDEAEAQKWTLEAAIARYLKIREKELKPSSYESTAYYLNKVWVGLHPKPLSAITKHGDVVPSLEKFIANGIGRPSARAARSSLNCLFGWAVEAGLVQHNPVAGTRNPAKNIGPRERVLTDDELAAIWNACSDDAFSRIIQLLILCPCRRDEIADLSWHEFDPSTNILTVPGSRTKNGKALVLTLAPQAAAVLKAVPKREGREYVFGTRPGKGFRSWSTAKTHLDNQVAKQTGQLLQHWTLHDLRRSCRSGLSRLGVRPDIAELCLGHSKRDLIAIYDKYNFQKEVGEALALWARHIGSIVKQSKMKDAA